MSTTQRFLPRYRVHLKVRYQNARDFVLEYAENLSKGGLFIRGAQNLVRREQVRVEITLPGYPPFRVLGEVAHVLDPEAADRLGRQPGVGIAVVRAPRNYDAALRSYLRLLGRRRDCLVFAEDPEVRACLEDAGYRAAAMPHAEELRAALGDATTPVLGLILDPGREHAYAAAAFAAGLSHRIHVVANPGELEGLLARLDAEIPRQR